MIQVLYRELEATDRQGLLRLFERVPPSIARQSNKLVYNAIIDDALRSKNVVILVASLGNRLVGYVIAAWDWMVFKRRFVLRHPRVGLLALVRRLKETGRARGSRVSHPSRMAGNALLRTSSSRRSRAWDESAATIAKIIHVGVDPTMRSRGVGRGLYASLIGHLRPRGIERVDALIDAGNVASLTMHRKAGWRIVENGDETLASIAIEPERIESNG